MIQNQTYVFLWCVLVGSILASIFDFFRILRRKGNTKNYIVYIQDIIYWLIVTFIIIMSAFMINSGELRGYMFIGYILGAIIYIVTLSPYILKFINKLLDTFEIFFSKIKRFIAKPIEKLKVNNKNVNF